MDEVEDRVEYGIEVIDALMWLLEGKQIELCIDVHGEMMRAGECYEVVEGGGSILRRDLAKAAASMVAAGWRRGDHEYEVVNDG